MRGYRRGLYNLSETRGLNERSKVSFKRQPVSRGA